VVGEDEQAPRHSSKARSVSGYAGRNRHPENAAPWSVNPDAESIEWYADWLARWAYFAFPDEIIRDRALNIALDKEIREED
jgi:hypothetical protein